ncbi:unnamed protein product [Moneuplotes crassus]|uniref:Uncharacterized protein n=1 Tax=Euplotes crassus TaxID=5936 RepID=A0AAD1XBF1_EUPCR|nr:unnamed protein product [Moneuplotes crassus]
MGTSLGAKKCRSLTIFSSIFQMSSIHTKYFLRERTKLPFLYLDIIDFSSFGKTERIIIKIKLYLVYHKALVFCVNIVKNCSNLCKKR